MRPEAYRLQARFTVFVLSFLAFLPAQAATQSILGELLDKESGQPVPTAQVALVDAEGWVVGRALSDTAGYFFIRVDLGTYSLVINRIGYAPEHVADIQVTIRSMLPLQIWLSPDALELPGLIVHVVPPPERFLETVGFYERKRLGFGHHIEIEESQRLQAFRPTDFLRRVPGLLVRNGEVRTQRLDRNGNPCMLQVLVNGIHRGVNVDEVLLVQEIKAIEVYKGPATVPGKWQHLAAQGSWDFSVEPPRRVPTCGVVVVWTKH